MNNKKSFISLLHNQNNFIATDKDYEHDYLKT
jgi:hypothetical protein